MYVRFAGERGRHKIALPVGPTLDAAKSLTFHLFVVFETIEAMQSPMNSGVSAGRLSFRRLSFRRPAPLVTGAKKKTGGGSGSSSGPVRPAPGSSSRSPYLLLHGSDSSIHQEELQLRRNPGQR
jgi:hypothetical protein